jgi:hypothetical protein
MLAREEAEKALLVANGAFRRREKSIRLTLRPYVI